MHNQSNKNPAIDSNRIKKIRSLLNEDAYIVNIPQIVNKIIDLEAALIRPRQIAS